MKILIIDRDPLATQLLQTRLHNEGHEVVSEPVRKTALEMIGREQFDTILIDPAPLPSVRQVTLPLRWEQSHHYFYIMQISHEPNAEEIAQAGLNDVIAKPFDWQEVQSKIANAQRLTGLMKHLYHTQEIISDGIIFGKRAFYQLVLSALDRAYRYDEKAFLMLVRVGGTVAAEMKPKIEKFLSSLHRRSDFLGHVDEQSYALLILRPALSSEPLDAVDRFGIALREFQQGLAQGQRPSFLIELWALPSAAIMREYQLES